jgi:hypothetical protein
LTIDNSTINQNTAETLGGGIYHGGASLSYINSSSICENETHARGAGIYNELATLHINRSLICTNESPVRGGGLYNEDGDVTISGSTFQDNTASQGGGINNDEGTMVISGSTFNNNSANNGGGIYNNCYSVSHVITLTNSTLSGNYASDWGGGINNRGGTTYLIHTTVTDNHADDSWDGTGDGGGIYNDEGMVFLKNSIIALNYDGSPQGFDIHRDCSGELISQDYNLIGDTAGCDILGLSGHNLIGQDPLLGDLANNGGATETHALLAGSPAYDHIPSDMNGCGIGPIDQDQRGVARPLGSGCDIGAVEGGHRLYLSLVRK